MSALEVSRRETAGQQTREHIRMVAISVFGASAVNERIESFDDFFRTVLDDPLAGVRAARLVEVVAAGALRVWALRARGAGAGWDTVATALDLTTADLDGRMPADAAWEWLIEHQPPAHSRTPGLSSAVWRCTTCGQRVRDSGPFAVHPDDREHGHADDCARHQAAVATWRHDHDESDPDDRGEF